MLIKFSPQRSDLELVVTKTGDTLVINGQVYDFSPLPDGSVLPVEAIVGDFFCDAVKRINGKLQVTLRLPHKENPDENVRFPKSLNDPPDGIVNLPKSLETTLLNTYLPPKVNLYD